MGGGSVGDALARPRAGSRAAASSRSPRRGRVRSTASSASRSRSSSGASTRRTAPACTPMTLMLWPITSWSSRAMRARSAATAARAFSSRSRSSSAARASSVSVSKPIARTARPTASATSIAAALRRRSEICPPGSAATATEKAARPIRAAAISPRAVRVHPHRVDRDERRERRHQRLVDRKAKDHGEGKASRRQPHRRHRSGRTPGERQRRERDGHELGHHGSWQVGERDLEQSACEEQQRERRIDEAGLRARSRRNRRRHAPSRPKIVARRWPGDLLQGDLGRRRTPRGVRRRPASRPMCGRPAQSSFGCELRSTGRRLK